MYNKHHEDVKILKEVFKQYLTSKDYEYMFNSTGNGSYSAYVGSYNSYKTGKHRRGVGKNGGVEELYKKIKDLFKKANVDEEDERVAYILNEIETESFLPKQATSLNAIIPNQVHLKELKKILSNAEEYHTFLKEKDDSGLSVSERIVELFKFQIPYYNHIALENLL
jgi:CRISPR-associated endonuclease Csn1